MEKTLFDKPLTDLQNHNVLAVQSQKKEFDKKKYIKIKIYIRNALRNETKV